MKCFGEHWGLEFSPEEIAAARAKNGLLSMELELSRACNLRCIYCYASSGFPLEQELSLEEVFDVVDQAVVLGARKIIILGGGEPLLYRDLLPVIDYLKEHRVTVDLFTNGTLITEEIAAGLFERQVSVVVKMNSRNPELQDQLAGKQGAAQKIINGLEFLQQAGYPDEQHTLGIETIICRQNYEELPELWLWARNRGIIPYIEMMTQQGRATEHPELELESGKIRELFNRLSELDRNEFGNHWIPHPPLAASQCARHEYSCTVTANGEIYPCPGVNVSAGNIRQTKLEDILKKSKPFIELRDIRRNIKGRCARCWLKQVCYGCRGHAYQVTGDYLAEDPLCWFSEEELTGR
ncbi:MAG: radical SAM protein [Thermodesulfobacteriota bacterium]